MEALGAPKGTTHPTSLNTLEAKTRAERAFHLGGGVLLRTLGQLKLGTLPTTA
jgi:hypothetical protein